MSIVTRIKEIGEKKGLNLTQIERGSGLNARTIYKWDKSSPSIDKVLAVANFLNVSLYWIATGKPEPQNTQSTFLKQYEQLSSIDKQKIKYFMEISLLNPPAVTYSTSSNISSHLLKEESTEYGTIAKEDSIAVLGYVAAGEPIEGISVPLGYIAPPVHADYVLIAKGHSMEPVIHDGEYIFVKSCDTLLTGDIGIFYIDGEVTCKKYQPEQDCILLQSLNPDFKPFKYSLNEEHDFKIQGKVVLTPTQKTRFISE